MEEKELMATVQMKEKIVVVPAALDNVGEQTAGLFQEVRKALADGYQPADIPTIIAATVTRFAGAVKDLDEVLPAVKDHIPESMKSVALNMVDAIFLPTVPKV